MARGSDSYSLLAIRYSLIALCARRGRARRSRKAWPQRPVKVLVPFAAGGNIDVMGRLAAARLSETFGQQFVVENRVGGNGVIATEAVARAPADGYTLLWASTSVIAIFPAISKVNYDPAKDLAPVSLFSTSPQVLIVNPKVPAKTVGEFVAYVKSQKEKLAYAGGGGPGSVSNLLMAIFLKRAGLEMSNVSYRGTALAADRRHRRPRPDHVHSDLGGAAAGARRLDPHAGGVERHALARGAGGADHRRVRLSRIRLHILDRHDGAGRDAEGDRRSHGGGVCARVHRSAIRRATWRRRASSRRQMRARRNSVRSSPRRSRAGARP